MIQSQQKFVCQRKESRRISNIEFCQISEIQMRDINLMHM